jgi:hypothetical protein
MGIFTKNTNPRAFARPLTCPHPHPKYPNEKCGAQKWKQDHQRSTPFRIRYICKQCGKGLIYDISNINPEQIRVVK